MSLSGAIGVSLFLLALELTLPPTAPTLTLTSAGHVLFRHGHLALLFASVLPALFLSLSIRLPLLARLSRGFTDHALYVPTYMFIIVAVFWTVVAGTAQANQVGMKHLADLGWLFTVQIDGTSKATHHQAWNYWASFDFPRVEWSAMTAAIQDIVLLVVIGVLNLPIYVPTMALTLDVSSYDMDHEFLGHGVSNILAGVVGTIPNLVVRILFTFTLQLHCQGRHLTAPGVFLHTALHPCRWRPLRGLNCDLTDCGTLLCFFPNLAVCPNNSSIDACAFLRIRAHDRISVGVG